MQKSLHSREQKILQTLLRDLRLQAGLRQDEVASALQTYQTFVSKYESGERMLDFLETKQVCSVFGLSLTQFATLYENALEQTD